MTDTRPSSDDLPRTGHTDLQLGQNVFGDRSCNAPRPSEDSGTSRLPQQQQQQQQQLGRRRNSALSHTTSAPTLMFGPTTVSQATEEEVTSSTRRGSEQSLGRKPKAIGFGRPLKGDLSTNRRASAPAIRATSSTDHPAMLRMHTRAIRKRRTASIEHRLFTAHHREVLIEISGEQRINEDDYPSWERLLTTSKFPVVATGDDAFTVDVATMPAAQALMLHNKSTANFSGLLTHLLSILKRMERREYSDQVPVEAYNAIFLARVFAKHFLAELTANEIQSIFESPSLPHEKTEREGPELRLAVERDIIQDPRSRSELVLDALVRLVLRLEPRTHESYDVYMEVVGCLIVFMSSQLYRASAKPDAENYLMNILLNNISRYALPLAERLLSNYVERHTPPSTGIGGIAVSAYHFLFSSSPNVANDDATSFPLAGRSILLLLLLANQQSPDTPLSEEAFPSSENAIRKAIGSVGEGTRDSPSDKHLPETSCFSLSGTGKPSVRTLYKAICQRVGEDETGILLYLLLVNNETFKNFVLSRTEPEELVLPILKIIYQTVETTANYPRLYLLLVSLLVLSQDEPYCQGIQNVIIPTPPWFTERLITNLSLGGITALVLIRTIQFNLVGSRDMYIHVNCVATLANIATTFQKMHQYVAQRLVSLFEMVAKRYQKLLSKVITDEGDVSPISSSTCTDDLAVGEILVLQDVIGLLLQIINVVFAQSVVNNPHLVYAVLHRKELFAPFRVVRQFSEMVSSVDAVIDHFHGRLADANLRAPSAEEITEVIQLAARTWSTRKTSYTSMTRFEYREATDSEGFFCPYIWSVILHRTLIHWDEERTQLLHGFCWS